MQENIDKSIELYNINRWSEGYFNVNNAGELVAQLDNGSGINNELSLSELVKESRSKGLRLPLLVRFNDILTSRVAMITSAFNKAISECDYKAKYNVVYPIKVNQQRTVVQKLLSSSKDVGLEAGSKPELLALLALLSNRDSLIICNGYKDREFIRLALLGNKMGHNVFIIIEKLNELNLVLEESEKMNVEANIGVRIRLTSMGAGKWQNTGGEKSKFGLSAAQILDVINKLKQENKLHFFKLLHSHLGSQIASLKDIQKGIQESARYYSEIIKLGVKLDYLDLGGGLGVDYEGSRSLSFCSMNYSLDEYAHAIVRSISDICNENNLPHPNIITESGRALTAHHSVLITDVISKESVTEHTVTEPNNNASSILKGLWKSYENISENSVVEIYNDAIYKLEEARSLFNQGIIDINEKAEIEQLYFAVCKKVKDNLNPVYKFHRDIFEQLNEKLADKLFCNFSVFQSLPDIWAIEQIFPIMPLNSLDKEIDGRVVLQDLTCDSDGKIDRYSCGYSIESTLPLPKYDPDNPYLLGIFMVGAYQEILGDMHNLFGDTDIVEVEFDENGEHKLLEISQGNSVTDVLEYVNFSKDFLLSSYQKHLSSDRFSSEDKEKFFKMLASSIEGYTYFED